LIVSVPRKGCYVTELSVQNCREIFEAREALECAALDLLQQRGRSDLSTVASVLEETSKLRKPEINDSFKKYDYLRAIAEFHFKLVEASGNLRILRFYDSIFFSLARYQNFYVFIPGLMDESQQVHEQILETLLKGNYDLGKKMLKTHIHSYGKYVEEILEKKGGNFSSASSVG
jgi:DNA-binding GntR family transcriptional regulator